MPIIAIARLPILFRKSRSAGTKKSQVGMNVYDQDQAADVEHAIANAAGLTLEIAGEEPCRYKPSSNTRNIDQPAFLRISRISVPSEKEASVA